MIKIVKDNRVKNADMIIWVITIISILFATISVNKVSQFKD